MTTYVRRNKVDLQVMDVTQLVQKSVEKRGEDKKRGQGAVVRGRRDVHLRQTMENMGRT